MNPLELLREPALLHAALVHLPVVLSMAGLLLLLLAFYYRRDGRLRWLAAVLYAALALSAFVTQQSGERARGLVPNTVDSEAWAVLDAHEELGQAVLYAALATFVMLAAAFTRNLAIREGALIGATVGGLSAFLLVSAAAHQGGLLVYRHNVGTAAMLDLEGKDPPETAAPEQIAQPEAMPAAAAEAENWLIPIQPLDLQAAREVEFEQDVYPILYDYCLECHEPPETDGGLDCSTVSGMIAGGEKAGPAVLPGKPDESPLILYIQGEMEPRMPRKDDPLPPELLHTLRQWIYAGALP